MSSEVSNIKTERKIFHWKGKRVTEKVWKKRMQSKKLAANLRNIYGTKNGMHNLKSEIAEYADIIESIEIEGRRIVHLQTLADQLFCQSCNSILSLKDTEKEIRYGLASNFHVKCRNCRKFSIVSTDKQHPFNKNKHYDVNTKMAAGTINAGNGNSHLNKMLAHGNIPPMNWKVFKAHEREVGVAIEDVARQSCEEAALEERQQTIQNEDKMNVLL